MGTEAGCGKEEDDKESTNGPNLHKIGKKLVFKDKGMDPYGFLLREEVWIFLSTHPEYSL